jgi:hypothetical protein
MARLDEFLTAAEFDALEQIDEGGNQSIAKGLSDRLLELGYTKETPTGLAITTERRAFCEPPKISILITSLPSLGN